MDQVNTADYSDVSKYSKDDLLICPFEISEKQAEDSLLKWLKVQNLAPGNLSEKSEIENCSGIYVPCWSFYTKTAADYNGVYSKYERDVNNNNKKNTVWIKCKSTIHHTFDNLLLQAFSREYSKEIDSILEFNKDKYTYYGSIESGKYTEEAYEKNLEQSWNEAQQNIDKKIYSFIEKDIKEEHDTDGTEIKNKTLTFSNTKSARVLVPVWIYKYSYNGKFYTCAVNGQNGAAAGSYPYSSWKMSAVCVFFILIVEGIGYAVMKSIKNY